MELVFPKLLNNKYLTRRQEMTERSQRAAYDNALSEGTAKAGGRLYRRQEGANPD